MTPSCSYGWLCLKCDRKFRPDLCVLVVTRLILIVTLVLVRCVSLWLVILGKGLLTVVMICVMLVVISVLM